MISRWAKVTVGIFLGVSILTGVLGGAVLWRLSKGPVGVDFLTPLVETAFADLIPGHMLDIGHTVLSWERGRGTFDLRLLGVSIQGREGADIVTLPMFKIGLDMGALVQGKVQPSTIEIDKVRIHLIRDAGGIIGFSDRETPTPGRGGDDEQPGKQSKVFLAVLKNLINPTGPASALSHLETVRLVNGGISLDDRMTGNIWNAPLVNFELRRNAAGLVGEVQLNFAQPNDVGEFQATFTYDPKVELLQLDGQISNLGTSALSLLAPSLGPLAQSNLTFSGSFNLSFAHLGRFPRARFDVSSGPGELSLPGLLAKPIEVSEVKARGRYDGANGGFELDLASVSFRTAAGSVSTLNLTVSAQDLGGNIRLDAQARLDTLPIDDLKSFWPQGLGERTRDWIRKNILAGTLYEASVTFAANLPDWDFGRAVIKSLNGTFGYRGVEAHYLRPLAPATDVLGEAKFDRKAMHLKIERANVSDLKVTGAEIDFIGSGIGKKLVVKRLKAEGPLRAALELLDHPQFKSLSGIGAVPEVIGGRVSLTADFTIPLRARPSFEDIEFQVHGALKQASFKNILMGQNAAHADLAFSLGRDGMTLNGPVEFAGIPVTLAWKEAFAETAPLRREIRADFHSLGDAERARLGLATEHFVGGPISGSLLAEIGRHGKGTVTTQLNLEDAELAIPFADWSKAAGEPAKASFTFKVANGRIVALPNVEVEAGTLKVQGTGSLGDTGTAIARLELVRLIIGKSDLRDVSILRRGASTEITIGDGVLDARPFLTPYLNATKAPSETATGGQRRENAMNPGLAFGLTAPALRRVYLARDRYLDNVAVRLNRTARGWELIQLRGRVPRASPNHAKSEKKERDIQDPNTFSLRYGPSAKGGHDLSISATDAGATLRALNILDGVRGGHLEIKGDGEGPESGGAIRGTIKMENFTVVDAPVLVRLLTVASLTGIGNFLRGGGLRFSRLIGDFTFDGRAIRTDGLRAHGSSIGLTARGEIDLKAREMTLGGTIVPLYSVNRVLGKIPLIGGILVGGKGEGLVGVTYNLEGKLGDPKISVNPASVLAPGILRKIFGKVSGSNEEEPQPIK